MHVHLISDIVTTASQTFELNENTVTVGLSKLTDGNGNYKVYIDLNGDRAFSFPYFQRHKAQALYCWLLYRKWSFIGRVVSLDADAIQALDLGASFAANVEYGDRRNAVEIIDTQVIDAQFCQSAVGVKV